MFITCFVWVEMGPSLRCEVFLARELADDYWFRLGFTMRVALGNWVKCAYFITRCLDSERPHALAVSTA